MSTLLKLIEVLETKQENGTITMNEQSQLSWAVEMMENEIYNKA